MAFLDDKTRTDIREVLGELPGTVALKLFTREHDCPTCGDLVQLLGELAATHPSIQLETIDMERAPGLATAFGVTQAPTLAVVVAEDRGVPRIVIGDQVAIEGAIPPRRFVEEVVTAARGG